MKYQKFDLEFIFCCFLIIFEHYFLFFRRRLNQQNIITMKPGLIALITGLSIFCSAAFAQSIPNSGFENWSYKTFYEDPDLFYSTNVFSYALMGEPNVTKTTESQSGNYAVRLETVATSDGSVAGAIFIGELGEDGIYGGIPYTERPDSLKGYARYDITDGDTAYVLALFKKFGAPLGICFIRFTGTQTEYESFSAPVQWLIPIISPDTLATAVLSSTMFGQPVPGSMIIVDNIQFTGASAPYPNGDFEQWNEYSAEEPDDWFSSNVFSIAAGGTAVTKTEDSYEGNYAVRIENTLTLWDDTLGFITNGHFGEDGPFGGMPVDSIPDKLSGYYKYVPVGNDTAMAGISLFYYNENSGITELLAENIISLLPTDNYTYFEIPVDYFSLPEPDTANFAFAAGNVDNDSAYVGLGSVLYIDALEITYKPHIVGIDNNITETNHKVYPNPASEKLFFEVYDLLDEEISLTIVNSQGKVVCRNEFKPSEKQQIGVDVSGLPGGIYYYNFSIKDKNYNGKLIIK